ncbi:MAG: hypothetical protein KGO81_02865 [Bacteroidota bacterium]|nr:hypothetical protein [Bacteroidota bacterium]
MSFQNLQLPDFVLASLYKDSLVVPEETTSVPKNPIGTIVQEEKKDWAWLGEHKKNISIIVNDPEAVFLRDEWLQLLSNMLNACKLNLADVAIINSNKHNITFAEVQQRLPSQFVLLFDVSTEVIGLPFSMPQYQLQQYSQCIFLMAPSIRLMCENTQEAKLEKSKLWLSLKKMFNI